MCIRDRNQALYELQKELWDYAEPGFLEHKSAKAMSDFLRREGFQVTEGLCGMDTAFVGVWGSGKPVICQMCIRDRVFCFAGFACSTDLSLPEIHLLWISPYHQKKPLIKGLIVNWCRYPELNWELSITIAPFYH